MATMCYRPINLTCQIGLFAVAALSTLAINQAEAGTRRSAKTTAAGVSSLTTNQANNPQRYRPRYFNPLYNKGLQYRLTLPTGHCCSPPRP